MLSVPTFGARTERIARKEAREALENEAARRGLTIKGKITYDADEKMPMWWNCEASARVVG